MARLDQFRSVSSTARTCAALAALTLFACERVPVAQIRYTEFGIAHIQASDYQGVGFGQGYAQARDNLCFIERGMLTFNGELARYFGPEASGSSLTGGVDAVSNDLFYGGINASQVIEKLMRQPAPLGPRSEVRELVRGYVNGFNQFLSEGHAIACGDAPWVRPMTEVDVYRRVYAVSTFLGLGFSAGGITSATPPDPSGAATGSNRVWDRQRALAQARHMGAGFGRPGSNAVAIGGSATDTGGGINVANPHLVWDGDMRWWQTQLSVPGQMNVGGAALLGVPLVVMGHTATNAWSITMAERARRFTLFELTLVAGDPTTYLVDGKPEAMQRRDVSVQVKQADGSLETVTRAQYWTRYGPVVGSRFFLEFPPWTATVGDEPGHAYVMRDANASNLRMLNTLFEFNRASSVNDVLRAIRETQGVPWWTVVAADAKGATLLSQIHVVPNVPNEHAERCNTELGRAYFEGGGVAVLDGSRSECAWQTDPDAVEPGIMGPGPLDQPRMPYLLGAEYVENSNDSYWLPNHLQRLTGFARILGDEATTRSVRTRGVISEITKQLAKGPFTRQLMQDLVLSNRSHVAELAVADTVRACRALTDGTATSSDGQRLDIRPACEVLARWDRRMNIDSRGALLFDRYWRRMQAATGDDPAALWAVAFDVNDPVHTPHTLLVDGPRVATALADAVAELDSAKIPLEAPFGDHHYVERAGKRIPLGGGGGDDGLGVFNILNAAWSSEHGYSEPIDGSGYLHVVQFNASPCPDTAMLLTYSESTDPSLPHHSDQTELYSQKRWVKERFCESEIAASPELETLEVGSRWVRRR